MGKTNKVIKQGNSIVQLTDIELEKVQEIWTMIQKKLQNDVKFHRAKDRIQVRLYELFKDEIKDIVNAY